MARLFIAVGEASGDQLACDLVRAIEAREPRLAVSGVCGPGLRELGARSVLDAESLQIVGAWEAIRAAPRLWWAARDLVEAAVRFRPDVVVTVDNPGFNLALARRLRARGLRVVHWVSPQVWAWRPGRVGRVAASVDRLLCLFPFEPAWYAKTGLRVDLTGHPIADRPRPPPRSVTGGGRPVTIGLAPGSRPADIERHWPILRAVAASLTARVPSVRFVVPVSPTASITLFDGGGEAVRFVRGLRAALMDADVFVTSAGTASLEVAQAGVPQVVFYRASWWTWQIGRRLIGVRHLALPNLLAGGGIIPEHIQSIDPERVADDVLRLLGPDGASQIGALLPAIDALGGGAADRAADAVLDEARAARVSP